jgi:hypothetical protein
VYKDGEFEFELLPCSTSSLITSFGFTSEALSSDPVFVQIQIDVVRYGNLAFGLIFGDSRTYNAFTVKMPASNESVNPFTIDYDNGNNLRFSIFTDPTGNDLEISVGTDSIDYVMVFQASVAATTNSSLTPWLSRLPTSFYAFISFYQDPTVELSDYDSS